MNLKNKIFKNNKTGEIIKVIDSFENIAILENKDKIDVNRLTNSDYYTEQVDPKYFFSNQGAYNILAEKIKNIPANQIPLDDQPIQSLNVNTPQYDNFRPDSNESAIVMSSEEDERAELARKYGAVSANVNSISKQNEAFAKLLGETPVEVDNTPIQKVEIGRDYTERQQQQQPVEDPILTMFKKTKRNVDLEIKFEVSNKIPRIDFIEMMEDSYEISIIDFLADEFTNQILKDPSLIRNKIKDKINELVYGKSGNNVNPQITDAVTQKNNPVSIEKESVKGLPKKTTVKKSRTKNITN